METEIKEAKQMETEIKVTKKKQWKEIPIKPDLSKMKSFEEQNSKLREIIKDLISEHNNEWVVYSENNIAGIMKTEKDAWEKAKSLGTIAIVAQITNEPTDELLTLDFSTLNDPKFGHMMGRLSLQGQKEDEFVSPLVVIDTGCSSDMFVTENIIAACCRNVAKSSISKFQGEDHNIIEHTGIFLGVGKASEDNFIDNPNTLKEITMKYSKKNYGKQNSLYNGPSIDSMLSIYCQWIKMVF